MVMMMILGRKHLAGRRPSRVVKAGGGSNWTFRHTVVTAGKKLVASIERLGLSSRLVNELPQWLCICAVRRQ